MDELVAKDVEPVEHEAQNLDGIPRPQGPHESALRGPEPFLPVFEPADAVVVLPERVEHTAIRTVDAANRRTSPQAARQLPTPPLPMDEPMRPGVSRVASQA